MQLYDNTIGRGYLMHAGSTTDVDGTAKVDMWECTAPQSAATEGHDLVFRRVNPYNEEVWNYWHAGQCGNTAADKGVYDGFLKNGIISFTAFADGVPDKTVNSIILKLKATVKKDTSGDHHAMGC